MNAEPHHHEPDSDALDWARNARRRDRFLATLDERLRRRRRHRALLSAGSLALVALGFFGWHAQKPRAPLPAETIASSTISTPHTQRLPDGTIVELKSGSDFTIEFSPEVRRVVLKAGVAHFQVEKNPAWPFVVMARGVEVRAVGTAFAVDLVADAVEVLVTEGRVAVQPAAALSHPRSETATETSHILLEAGKRVALSPAQPAEVTAISAVEMAERLAWRIPRLEFSSIRLREVIDLINRHSRVQLQLGDAEAGNVEISGVLRADNIDPLLRMLEDYYGVSVERSEASATLRLRRVR